MKRLAEYTEDILNKKPKLVLPNYRGEGSYDSEEDFSIQERLNLCLEHLASLLQESAYDRVATCLINRTIIIAADKIHAESLLVEPIEPRVELLGTIMQYFSDFANERPQYKKSREEVFKQICIANLHGNTKGHYTKLGDELIGMISRDVLSLYGDRALYKIQNQQYFPIDFAKKILAYTPNLQDFVSVVYKTITFIARDFLSIEAFITVNSNDNKNDLVAAFKGQENQKIFIHQVMPQVRKVLKDYQGLVQYERDPGYIILDLDVAGVHAKAKIIEYLVYTGIIKNIVTGEQIYIGTSGLCCKLCNDFAEAVNKVFCSGEEIIQITKTQALHFDWVGPMICEDKSHELKTGPCSYYNAVSDTQVKKLNKLVPILKTTLKISDTYYQDGHTRESTLNNMLEGFDKKEVNTNVIDLKNTSFIKTKWDDYLIIKDRLTKKGFPADNILLLVQNEKELEMALDQINQPNCAYMLPLAVNATNGTFYDTNQLIGLYIVTDEDSNIVSIKYINPTSKPINQLLALKLLNETGAIPEDLTARVKLPYNNKESTNQKFNDNVFILVQFAYDLMIVDTCSFKESIGFEQKHTYQDTYQEYDFTTNLAGVDSAHEEAYEKGYN